MESEEMKLKWLENKLETAGNGFRQSELYRILKRNLSKMGYWKNKPRGKPNHDIRLQ